MLHGRCRFGLLVAGLVLLGSLPAAAGGRLSVRLVEAHNEGTGVSSALGDLAGMLQRNLPYKRFDLVGSGTAQLPGEGSLSLQGDVALRYAGASNALRVSLHRGGKRLLSSTIALAPGKPFVLGGFRGPRGRMMVVLILR